MNSQYDQAINLIQSSQSIDPKRAMKKLLKAKIEFTKLNAWSEVHECNRLMATIGMKVVDKL